ncbi:MAG: 50S ribosomal protein L25 [Planctomycetota bacterium]
MSEAKIECAVREKVGSRDARKLRAMGRMVGSLQADADHGHVDLHFDEDLFHAARRAHAHLFDLEIGGSVESAIVRELQWDALGDRLLHVEFKRVIRGQKTESTVPLRFVGNPAGILTHDFNDITISCIPSLIPDSIDVVVEGLEPGTHLKAADVTTPEGIELVIDPDVDIAVITELRETAEPAADGEEAEPGIEPGPAAGGGESEG